VTRLRDPVQEFLATESAGGIVLAAAAAVAILWATLATASYAAFRARHPFWWTAAAAAHLTLEQITREGLMPIFFFVVGLEIKRELTVGELSGARVARVPAMAALGRMIVPALVYLAITHGGPGADGWGIPMATDIAFVVGALQLLGSRVPAQLKVFMLAIAVVDDIGAIVVIAVWYSHGGRAGGRAGGVDPHQRRLPGALLDPAGRRGALGAGLRGRGGRRQPGDGDRGRQPDDRCGRAGA